MMKRKFALILVAAVGLAIYGFVLPKEVKKDPPPADGVVRKWTSKEVKKPKTIVLPCGIEYTVTHEGNGPLPKPGDRVRTLYVGKYLNDTVFDASYKHNNMVLLFHPGRGGEVIAGWDTVFKYLHAGDKAIMKLPSKYAYGTRGSGQIPPNSDLKFEVEVIDVLPKPTVWDAKGKDTITTPSGLKMVMFESHPDSAMAQRGQTVTIDYSGYLLNGTMFDSSVDRGQPFSYGVGKMPLIAGWSEAIGLMHEGEKAQVIIPYQLAYGANGRPPLIPGKSDLIFDMHLIDIK